MADAFCTILLIMGALGLFIAGSEKSKMNRKWMAAFPPEEPRA